MSSAKSAPWSSSSEGVLRYVSPRRFLCAESSSPSAEHHPFLSIGLSPFRLRPPYPCGSLQLPDLVAVATSNVSRTGASVRSRSEQPPHSSRTQRSRVSGHNPNSRHPPSGQRQDLRRLITRLRRQIGSPSHLHLEPKTFPFHCPLPSRPHPESLTTSSHKSTPTSTPFSPG